MSITVGQRVEYLWNTLRKMGYKGSLDDVREVKRFIFTNTEHKLYPKAVLHWNEIINGQYVYKEKPGDRLRSASALYSSIHEGKR